nr:ribonuclease H-like domain-containing protein [Tanacetum cinerariifolium]
MMTWVQWGTLKVGWEYHNYSSIIPIVERIDEIERQIIDEKITLVDDDGKPLPKVISKTIVDSDNEVEDVVDDYAVFMASIDDDYDSYDDDLYKSHDMSQNLEANCDELGIAVRDRTKK